jgi:hypothetical protein
VDLILWRTPCGSACSVLACPAELRGAIATDGAAGYQTGRLRRAVKSAVP